MESEPKPEKEIHVEKESPVKDPDPKHDPAESADVPNADHGSSDSGGSSAPGSDATAARSASRKSVHWSPELVSESPANPHAGPHGGSNPYITSAPAGNEDSFSIKESMETVKNVLGRWGRKVAEATRKAEDLAGNTWQHHPVCFINFNLWRRSTASICSMCIGRIYAPSLASHNSITRGPESPVKDRT
ncbi:hypothetical protein CRG98_050405 [Punica granatum]|uniref:GLABRA2 expression modulator-like n=1 Tax=Punica granatum TaxID=22663 RepID=A0A2I0GBN4_PUNGR|nr:hypothetical protein CRG98_050405 [Punica granatum]